MARIAYVGKHGRLVGESCHAAKLTWDKVNQIRRLREQQGLSYTTLAKMYGVTPENIASILKGKSWVTEPAREIRIADISDVETIRQINEATGDGCASISKKTGMTRISIFRVMEASGINGNPQRGTEISATNRKAKTHCRRGHELTPDNVKIVNGARNCRKCHALAVIRHYEKKAKG